LLTFWSGWSQTVILPISAFQRTCIFKEENKKKNAAIK
jgi:hypothetical protein